jgi:hypothetical protein
MWLMLGAWSLAASAGAVGSPQAPAVGERSEPTLVAWPMVPAGDAGLTLLENLGQWPGWVNYAGRLGGSVVRLEQDGIGIEVRTGSDGRGVLAKLVFEGADPASCLESLEPREGIYNFFLGNDPQAWVRGVQAYGRVIWRDLYPGIDLVVRSGADGSGLEYDLLVAAGASLEQVRIRFEGIDELRAGAAESLEGSLAGGLFLQLPATCWQVLPEGGTELVKCTWREREQGLFQPEVAGWDPALTLVIDPELLWCTYLGASNQDESTSMDGNARGEIVVSGVTNSASFVRTPGTFQSPIGPLNVFAAKFRQADGRLVYSSVFGGGPVNSGQVSTDVALDDKGRATVVGRTTAANFPTTPGSFQPVKQSAINKESGFVIQFTSSGDDLVFGTYLEGPQRGSLIDTVGVDQDGVVVGGTALGPDFPVTAGAYQTQYMSPIDIGDGFVARLDPTGGNLVWSTLLGDTATDSVKTLALAADGSVVLAGRTASHNFPTTPGAYQESIPSSAWITTFVSKLSAHGDALVWSSYLCGSTKNGEEDTPIGIALDAAGTVFVSGGTSSPGFPTTPGAYKTVFPPGAFGQGFTTRFQTDGSALIWSTLTGGNLGGGGAQLAVDPSGVVTLVGGFQEQYPLTPGAYDLTYNGGASDIAVFRLAPGGDRLFYGSYIGGPGEESSRGLALAGSGRLSFGATVFSPGGYPTTLGAFQTSFQGGQADAALTTLDLLLQGLELAGASLPSCLGTLQINATEMPLAGSTSFALWCSGAPPSSSGWLLLGTALAASTQTSGVPQWVSPSGPLARIPVSTDMFGYAEVALPLSAASAGDKLAAQFLFHSPPTCAAPTTWSSSPALVITVQ